jgi:hypothetical protein
LTAELLRARATLPHDRGLFDHWGQLVADDEGLRIEDWRAPWVTIDRYSVSDDTDVEWPYHLAVTIVSSGDRVRFIMEPPAGRELDAVIAAHAPRAQRFRSKRTENKEWLPAALFLVAIIAVAVLVTQVL